MNTNDKIKALRAEMRRLRRERDQAVAAVERAYVRMRNVSRMIDYVQECEAAITDWVRSLPKMGLASLANEIGNLDEKQSDINMELDMLRTWPERAQRILARKDNDDVRDHEWEVSRGRGESYYQLIDHRVAEMLRERGSLRAPRDEEDDQ